MAKARSGLKLPKVLPMPDSCVIFFVFFVVVANGDRGSYLAIIPITYCLVLI